MIADDFKELGRRHREYMEKKAAMLAGTPPIEDAKPGENAPASRPRFKFEDLLGQLYPILPTEHDRLVRKYSEISLHDACPEPMVYGRPPGYEFIKDEDVQKMMADWHKKAMESLTVPREMLEPGRTYTLSIKAK